VQIDPRNEFKGIPPTIIFHHPLKCRRRRLRADEICNVVAVPVEIVDRSRILLRANPPVEVEHWTMLLGHGKSTFQRTIRLRLDASPVQEMRPY